MSMELYPEDLKVAMEMFEKLAELAGMEHLHAVEIRFRANDGPWITVGYGEAGDPCILNIEPEYTYVPPPKLNDFTGLPYTINCGDYNSIEE